jgi:hypothetical protein
MERSHSSAFSLCLLLAIASLILFAPPAAAQGRCDNFGGTIIASYDPEIGWVGRVYMSVDGGAPVNGTILDQYDPGSTHPTMETPSGNWSGNEVLTFTVENVGSFQMRGHYTANAASSPFLWSFHETGQIDPLGATGAFSGMTGHLSIQGVFTIGGGGELPPSDLDPWWWIAEITGSVCDAPEF